MNDRELQMFMNGYKWRDQRISELENEVEQLTEEMAELKAENAKLTAALEKLEAMGSGVARDALKGGDK